MGEASPLQTRIKEIRNETLSLIDIFSKKGPELELPAPKPALASCRDKIDQDRYKVLVVGEMKRGKSSFINAMIGRPILPTNVDVATCQVFQISQASQEAYRLRFEDDSTKEITLTDLPRYGSQVVANEGGTPQLKEMIRWIEVEVPAKFLPEGVSILDTPGLGSLYAAHSEITQRFVPQADAVIYVLDIERPFGDADAKMIDKILQVTPDIFFILTKIDQVVAENWQDMRKRNEALLREKFGDRLSDPRVWPISSRNLMQATAPQLSEKNGEKLVGVSHYRELSAALRAFLYRAVGLSRAAEAGALLDSYYDEGKTTLENRRASLSEENKAARQQIQQKLSDNRRSFEAEWGPNGSAIATMMREIRETAAISRRAFEQAIQSRGPIEQQARNAIDSTTSVDGVNAVLQNLSSRANEATTDMWNRCCSAVMRKCADVAEPFAQASHSVQLGITSAPALSVTKHGWFSRAYDRAKGGIREAQPSLTLGTIATGATVALGLVAAPVILAAAAIGTAIWAFFKGGKKAKAEELNAAKREAHSHLDHILASIRQYFTDVDLGYGRRSRVDEYFDGMVNDFQQRIQQSVADRGQEIKAEETRLLQASNYEEEDRKRKLQETNRRCDAWQALGIKLKTLDAKYAAIDKELTGSIHSAA
jgi:GTP-binding protein EngB required for normal cell division